MAWAFYRNGIDENTFIIYRKGFLALDSGTRPEPGSHLFQYYCRTVAHNGVLIRREGEVFPPYWGRPAPGEPAQPVPNDGGMNSMTGAQVRAFYTCPDFTYIASDATACYSSNKCELALRQFMHIQPNFFVIFDRVKSVRPEYTKTWLLHTAREPRIEGVMFAAEQDGGKIFCRTFLPTNAVLAGIGGPGKEFWSDGRNWPLPTGSARWVRWTEPMGAWRVEVSPAAQEKETIFLHLIEAGLAGEKETTTNARVVEAGDRVGLEFAANGTTNRVLFARRGEPSCAIVLTGRRQLSLEPGNTVAPQAGWADEDGKQATRAIHPGLLQE